MDKTKFKALLADARGIVEKAVSEGRPMTEEERNLSFNMVEEAKQGLDDAALQRKIDELEAEAVKGEEALEQRPASADLGSQFLDSKEFKSWMRTVAPNGRIPDSAKGLTSPAFPVSMPLEKKTVIVGSDPLSAGAFMQNDQSGEYGALGYKTPVLRDLISVRQTDSDAVDFVQQVAKVTQAAAVAEALTAAGPTVDPATHDVVPSPDGGYKPEGEMSFYKVTSLVETIAVWLPVTKRAMADAGQLRGIINQELRDAVNEEIEDMIIEGNGMSTQFQGLANTPNILTQAFGVDLLTTSRKAITNLNTNGHERATAFVLSPLDWEGLELALFAAAPYLPSQKTLWRIPVVEHSGMAVKTGYLGNWKKAVLWDRQDASISVSDSHADFFVRNILAILGEARAAFGVIKPTAFVKIATQA